MTTDDIILHIFYLVATSLPAIPSHDFVSQAKLYPSELVTIDILFALKGGCFRAFYRWLDREAGSHPRYIVPEAERMGGQVCHFGSFPNFCQLFPLISIVKVKKFLDNEIAKYG
jgi:hypothetical protein